MIAQAYRLDDAQFAARICLKVIRSGEDGDTCAYWARTAGRAAINYLAGLADSQDVNLESVQL